MNPSTQLEWVFGARLPWSGVWLNRHYISRELAAAEHVVYVLDPLPSRPSRRTRRLALEHEVSVGAATAPAGIDVVRLPELPLQRFGAVANASQQLGARRVRALLRESGSRVVVQLPRARLFPRGALMEALTVYYCSDDFRQKPDGSTDDSFCKWEDEVLRRADLVVAVSEPLCARLAERHDRVRLVENGADPRLFHPHAGPAPADVATIRAPRIGFVGSVRRPLIDLEAMATLAGRRRDWSFCLVGWFDDDDPGIEALRCHANVHLLGPRPRDQLSAYLGAMDVLTCPHPPGEMTAVMSPLKAYEAMAAGRPLVALHAPVLRGLLPQIRDTSSLDAFEAAIDDVLTDPPDVDPGAVESVSWAARAQTFRTHVLEALADVAADLPG